MKLNLLFLTVVLITSMQLSAQSEHAKVSSAHQDTLQLKLRDAIEHALEANYELKKVNLNKAILKKQIQSVKGMGLPQVAASLNMTDNYSLPQQLLPGEVFGQTGQIAVKFGVRYGINAGLELNQIVFNKEFFANLKQLESLERQTDLQLLQKKEELVYSIVQTYIQYQINAKQYEVVQTNAKRLQQLIDIAEIQYKNGIINRLNVDQLKVNHANLISQLHEIDNMSEQLLNVIKYYLSLDMDQVIQLTDQLEEDPNELEFDQSLDIESNINYQFLLTQLELKKMEQEVVKAGYYPSVSLFTQFNYTGQGNEANFNQANYSDFTAGLWGLRLSVPVFDGLQKHRKVQENKIAINQLELEQQQLNLAIQMEFKNALNSRIQSEAQIRTQTSNLEVAQSLFEATQLSYHEGVASLSELLDAETSLKEAQAQYINASLNFKIAALDYLKASGELVKLIQD